jgi:hypothetical protein
VWNKKYVREVVLERYITNMFQGLTKGKDEEITVILPYGRYIRTDVCCIITKFSEGFQVIFKHWKFICM